MLRACRQAHKLDYGDCHLAGSPCLFQSTCAIVAIERQGGDTCDDFASLCQNKCLQNALRHVDLRYLQNTHFNAIKAYNYLLQRCVEVKALMEGKQIHTHITKNDLGHIRILNNSLLQLYIKCSDMRAAQEVFDKMSFKDSDSWTLLIGGYIAVVHLKEAFELFARMECEGVKPNGVTCLHIIKACATAMELMKVHAYIICLGLGSNVYVGNTLLDMYFDHGSVEDATLTFDKLPTVSLVSWNMVIAGLIRHGFLDKAIELFQVMKLKGEVSDEVTFISICKACTSNIGCLKRLHVEICHHSLETNNFVASALIDVYAVNQSIKLARKVFEVVPLRDVPLWNSIILCYAEHGDALEAMNLFGEMEHDGLVPDKVTYLSIVKACISLKCLAMGRRFHMRTIQVGLDSGAFVGGALIDMYIKCDTLEDARHVFDSMPHPDLVSWNTLMAGYATYESAMEVFSLFETMEMGGVKPDKVSFLAMLKACSIAGAFEKGLYVHTCISNNGIELDVPLGSSLIDMYGKCGSIFHARQAFEAICAQDKVSWSAMLAGYAQHGLTNKAFEIFMEMQRKGIAIDDVTFVGILTACAHGGLVEEGCYFFDFVMKEHGIMPTANVCACMVNLYGRAGQLEEAMEFIKEVEVEVTSSIWLALLSACKLFGDKDLAEHASERSRELEPHCTSAFVLLSNAYAAIQSETE